MKTYNKVMLSGRLHSYDIKTMNTKKGEALAGTVTVEVDPTGTTVDARVFAYPRYNNGNTNATYGMLESILDGDIKTIINDGDAAEWISVDASIDVDYFAPRGAAAKTPSDLNRSQKIRASFVNFNKKQIYANEWRCDMLITGVKEIEEDPERGTPHKAQINGYIIDDYNKRLAGVRFEAYDKAPINYLLGLSVTEEAPVYSSVKGSFRKVVVLKTIEGAFGDAETKEYINTVWNLSWMPAHAYEFGEDITVEQYAGYMANLDEYRISKLKIEDDTPADDGDLPF